MLVSMVNEGHMPLVLRGVEDAIGASFATDDPPMRNPSQLEIKQRFARCVHIIKVLRGDKMWGTHRIVDKLPSLLRMDLDGADWDTATSRQRMWTPDAPHAINSVIR